MNTQQLHEWVEKGIIISGWQEEKSKPGTMSLLAAISPEVRKTHTITDCPLEVAPPWLAQLTEAMSAMCSKSNWKTMAHRYIDLAQVWKRISPEAWKSVDYAVRSLIAATMTSYISRRSADPAASTALLTLVFAGKVCDEQVLGLPPSIDRVEGMTHVMDVAVHAPMGPERLIPEVAALLLWSPIEDDWWEQATKDAEAYAARFATEQFLWLANRTSVIDALRVNLPLNRARKKAAKAVGVLSDALNDVFLSIIESMVRNHP